MIVILFIYFFYTILTMRVILFTSNVPYSVYFITSCQAQEIAQRSNHFPGHQLQGTAISQKTLLIILNFGLGRNTWSDLWWQGKKSTQKLRISGPGMPVRQNSPVNQAVTACSCCSWRGEPRWNQAFFLFNFFCWCVQFSQEISKLNTILYHHLTHFSYIHSFLNYLYEYISYIFHLFYLLSINLLFLSVMF